ncbi:MAG: MMPL family transporter [Planctomycetaceae bacterium]|jgi:predicted RND superfamily exporter protein|nr:MMPL family transporter [Planctomycetaceae bacterium]
MKNAFFNRYGFRILVIVFFLLPLIGQGTRRTVESNSNNVADWLPDSFVETNQYQWFLKNFPFERFVVVSWEGCTMDDSRVEMFAQKLVPGQTIDNIGQWMTEEHIPAEVALEENGAKPLPDEEQDSPETPPLNPDADSSAYNATQLNYFKGVLTGPRLVRMLKDQYDGEGIGGIKLSDETIFRKLRGILIGPDGQSTALLVTLTKEAPQGKNLAKVLDAIRDVGRECGVQPQIQADNRFFLVKAFSTVVETVKEMIYGRNPRMDGVILGGPPVDNVAITKEGEQTLMRLAGLCGLIGLTLAWLCFRDFRLTMFIFWMAIISAGIALASVSFSSIFLGSFGTCDAILLSMPALVYVLAMSGAIHLINYYHDAILEHGLDMAPERAVRHALYPCFFANFTTALGLVSLCMSGLIPICKFGFYSALGIMLQLALLFYYLPTLLHYYPSHHVAAQKSLSIAENSLMQKFWRFWSGLMIRNAKIVALGCFVVMIISSIGMVKIIPSVKMMRFFSSDSEIIHHYTWLEEHLGPLVPMEVVVKFDNEHCTLNTLNRLRLVEKVCTALQSELEDSIGGVMSAETMMPPTPRPGRGATAVTNAVLFNAFLDRGRSELRDFITVEGNLSLLPGEDRIQNLEQLGITADEADRLIGVQIDDVKKLIYTPADEELAGISLGELGEWRKKAIEWEKKHGTDLWRVSLRVWSLKKDIDYADFIQDVKNVVEPIIAEANGQLELEASSVEAVYTGMVPVVYKTQHELYKGLAWSFVTSFLMIGVVLAFILKSPAAGFLAMVPNVFPVLIVFGFMGHFGILVDIGTMMTASVALGIATDDTIHFLTWFRHGIEEGKSRADATRYAFSRCASAMVQTTLIAGFGLAAFALSTFTPTQMFGVMMLAILLAATFGDLVFMAAILNTPLGKVFEPRKNTPKGS